MLSGQGKVQYFTQTNSIVVTDIPSKQKVIKDVIEKLDSKTKQVMIEASMVEVSLNKEKELGITWNIAGSAMGAARPITFPFDVHHTGGDFYPPVDTSSATTQFTTEGSIIASESSADFAEGKAFPYAEPDDFTYGYLSFTELQARLSALQSTGDANLISCPRIVTLDNHEAKITVGTTVPIPIYERNEQTGSMEITGYDEHDFGVTLTVTPYINQDGYITMDITPSVKEITGFTGPNNERPITATREASTRVMIKNGMTVVIGGLLKDSEVVDNSKVPLLGDIPLLGYMFRSNKRVNEKVDLLIFITPQVVEDAILLEADKYKLEEVDVRKARRIAENAEDAAAAHIEAGKNLMEQGKMDDAAKHFRRALQLEPKNKDAEKLLKKCELQTSKPTLVPIPEEKVSPAAEATADQNLEMGRELYNNGSYEEAMRQFEKIIEQLSTISPAAALKWLKATTGKGYNCMSRSHTLQQRVSSNRHLPLIQITGGQNGTLKKLRG